MENISGAYNIDVNITNLINSNSELLIKTYLINEYVNELNEINKLIKENWENENEESDIFSSTKKINECIDKITEIIIPTLSKFTETMNNLIIAHQSTANKTVELEEL